MNDELLTPREAAAHLKVSTNTLRDWRLKKKGPPWTKAEGQVRYFRSDLDDYLKRNAQGGTGA